MSLSQFGCGMITSLLLARSPVLGMDQPFLRAAREKNADVCLKGQTDVFPMFNMRPDWQTQGQHSLTSRSFDRSSREIDDAPAPFGDRLRQAE